MNKHLNEIHTNSSEEQIDLRKYLKRYLDLWVWFLISMIIAVSVAFVINKYAPRAYKVSSTVLVKDDKGYRKSNNLVNNLDVFGSQINLQNEIGIMQSYSLHYITVSDLQLYISYSKVGKYRERDIYSTCPFTVVLDTSHFQLLDVDITISPISKTHFGIEYSLPEKMSLMKYSTGEIVNVTLSESKDTTYKFEYGSLLETPFFSFRVFPVEVMILGYIGHEYNITLRDINKVTASYKSRFSAEPINDDASIVKVSLIDPIPQRAVNYVNRLVINYIEMGLNEKNLIASKTIEFIDQQLSGITDSLSLIEKDLAEFRTENKIVDLSAQGQAIFQKLQTLEYEKSMEQMKVGYYNYLLTYVQNDSVGNDLIAPSAIGVDDPLLTQLIGELAQLYATRDQMRSTSTSRNPYLQEINAKIETLRRSIIENVTNILTNAKYVLTEKQRELNRVQIELQSLPETERQLISIERMFTVNDQIYTFLLEKRAEAAISRASNIADHKVVDTARLEGRIKPKSKQNIIFALIFGLIIPALVIFIVDKINNKIHLISEVEMISEVPILGCIIHNENDSDLPFMHSVSPHVTESFRGIRTNLDFFVSEKERKVITVTSVNPGEGKSFCSMHLAGVFALAGKKTLLVGGDIRKPDLARYFNITSETGLSSFLSHSKPWEKTIVKSIDDHLDFLPAGTVPPNPAELLSSDNVDRIFENLDKYDIVIFDTSPIGVIADAAYIIRRSDINLFVTRFRRTSRQDIKMINQIVYKLSVKNPAIVCNDQKLRRNKQNQYYYYGHVRK